LIFRLRRYLIFLYHCNKGKDFVVSRKRILCGVSLFSAVFGGSALAATSLPSVNVDGRAVSARALFGEPPIERKSAPAPVQGTERSARPATPAQPRSISSDVLLPERPKIDLWAKSRDSDNSGRTVVARTATSANVAKPQRLPESDSSREDSFFTAPATRSSFDDMLASVRSSGVTSDRSRNTIDQSDQMAHTGQTESIIREEPQVRSARNTASIIQNRAISAPSARAESDLESRVINLERLVARQAEPHDSPVSVSSRPSSNPAYSDEVSVRRVVVPMEESRPQNRGLVARSASAGHDLDDVPLTQLTPMQLKRAFQKTYISENKHLSTYKIDDRFDVASEISYDIQGFDSSRDLSEVGGVRPLEIKVSFRGSDSALSRDNYSLLAEYAGIVASNPKRAVQISIPEKSTRSFDGRRLAARRLAIVEQVLKDTGVSDQRIIPVLSQRDDNAFVLRVISSDVYQTLSERQQDMFGDTISSKSYKSLSW